MTTRTKAKRCPVTPDKIRYRSEADVVIASRRIQMERGLLLDHYHCDWCNDWHLTNPEREEK